MLLSLQANLDMSGHKSLCESRWNKLLLLYWERSFPNLACWMLGMVKVVAMQPPTPNPTVQETMVPHLSATASQLHLSPDDSVRD